MANRPVYMAGSGKLLCLRESGDVVGFTFEGETFPTLPRTFFYDWLYIHALTQHPELAEELVKYDAFTGIVFTPEKSVNCQAAAAATYVSLYRKGLLEQATASKAVFLHIVYELELPVPAAAPRPTQLGAKRAGAAKDAVGREMPEEYFVVSEAVNERDNNRVRANAGHGTHHGGIKLGRLGDEDDNVHDADIIGCVCGLDSIEVIVGVGVDDELQPVLSDLVHMGLVFVHKGNIRAALAQISGEAAFCRAAADHCYSH